MLAAPVPSIKVKFPRLTLLSDPTEAMAIEPEPEMDKLSLPISPEKLERSEPLTIIVPL